MATAERNLIKEAEDLGILNIEADGELTKEAMAAAIDSFRDFYSQINRKAIADHINKASAKANSGE